VGSHGFSPHIVSNDSCTFGGAADTVPIAHTVWRWLVETVAWKLLWLVEIQPAERTENQWPQQSRCADKAEEISAQRCFEKWHKHITFSVFGTELQ
jgi:hypothetical protein